MLGFKREVPDHVIQRLENLLTNRPAASNAELARFMDMTPREFNLRMCVDHKFRAVVYLKRFASEAAATCNVPAADAFREPDTRAYSDVHLTIEDDHASEG